jgi:3-deoxy-D-manno-octulosonic-acid transferase
MFVLYSFLLTIGFILLSPLFLLKREKYASGFWQRLGRLPEFESNGKRVVWLHCVSVGEANAARPLVEEIKKQFPDCRLIVSTTTKTGQELARNIFREKAETIFYFPFDWKFSVRRALQNFRPDVVLLLETELWFNFIHEACQSGAITVIVNGRLSEKSFRRYCLIKNFMRRVLRRLDLALMQTSADAERLKGLGIEPEKVKITGNIKFDQIPVAVESDLTKQLGERFAIKKAAPLIVAASTHAPEERWILQAFETVRKNFAQNSPRLLIAPRHPERFPEVADLIKETGFQSVRRSENESESDKRAEIILLDTIGELRSVFPLAEIVFVGGSLIRHGGQSVLEPAAAARAIVTGFYTMNFAAIVREFSEKQALIQLAKTDEKRVVENLAEAFHNLLGDAQKRARLGQNALAVMKENRGATARTIENLKPLLQVKENC